MTLRSIPGGLPAGAPSKAMFAKPAPKSDLPGAIHTRPLLDLGMSLSAFCDPFRKGDRRTIGGPQTIVLEGVGPGSPLAQELRSLGVAFAGHDPGGVVGRNSFLAIPWESVVNDDEARQIDSIREGVANTLLMLGGEVPSRGVRHCETVELPAEGCPDLEVNEGEALDLVRTHLSLNKGFSATGRSIRKHVLNVYRVLECVQAFAGAIRFDQLHMRPYVVRALPWDATFSGPRPWSKDDENRFSMFLLDAYDLEVSSTATIEAAVLSSANNCKIHKVRDRIKLLQWDGKARVGGWLSRYLGVRDSEYSRLVGTWWLLGAVARAMEPGCRMDYMLILEGPQRAGKSSSIRILGEVITQGVVKDTPFDFNPANKDRFQQLDGVWIYELAELVAFQGEKWEAAKAFISSSSDYYRRSYGSAVEDNPRRCVLAGTKNPEQDAGYLRDPTGASRFWPVQVGRIDFAALKADALQLWAEAYALYSTGWEDRRSGVHVQPNHRWWPLADEEVLLDRERGKRARTGDVWVDALREKLIGRGGYLETDVKAAMRADKPVDRPYKALKTLGAVLDLIGVKDERKGSGDGRRAAACLRELGFKNPGNDVRIRQTSDGASSPHWFFGDRDLDALRRRLLAEVFAAEERVNEAQSGGDAGGSAGGGSRLSLEDLAQAGEPDLLALNEAARDPAVRPGVEWGALDEDLRKAVLKLLNSEDSNAQRMFWLFSAITGISVGGLSEEGSAPASE